MLNRYLFPFKSFYVSGIVKVLRRCHEVPYIVNAAGCFIDAAFVTRKYEEKQCFFYDVEAHEFPIQAFIYGAHFVSGVF